jgi:hypothetical protein
MNTERQGNLVFIPFIPYAFSLSLSLAYKRLRHTKIPSHRLRARNDLMSICYLLDQLGEQFQIASTMSDMGKVIVAEMDRVAGIPSHSRQEGASTDPNGVSSNFETLTNGLATNTSATPQENQSRASTVAARDSNSYISETASNTDMQGQTCIGPDLNGFAFWGSSSVDIFSMFDQNFGLQEVDDMFERNLNMSL